MSAIFFHIPKTAGTTLTELILKNNPADGYYHFRERELLELDEIRQKADEYRFVFGHFRLRPELAGDHFLLTFMREPVDRCLSQFFHFRRHDRLPHIPLTEQMEFFLSEEEVKKNGVYNLQTQWMAGMVKQKDVLADPGKHLELATENLRQLNLVGIAEHFRESAFMLCQSLGWKKWHYVPHNVHPSKDDRSLLLKNFGAELRRINAMDAELYRRATELFEKQRKEIAIPPMKKLEAISLSKLKGFVNRR